MNWIKTSEQMPENDDVVLVWPRPEFGVESYSGQYIKYHKKGPGWFAQVTNTITALSGNPSL